MSAPPALTVPIDTVARRAALFRETPVERLQRMALGSVWALQPERIGELPALARLWAVEAVGRPGALPHPEQTLSRGGACGIVRDLSVDTLMAAYARGIFTFAHFGPLKWLSPDPRCVLFTNEFHLGKTARRLVKLARYTVTFDSDFPGVIKACAGRRNGKWHLTWITPRIMRAYADLYDAGHVHSFEVWDAAGNLVGGGYGVAVGGAFFTESLFSRERDASKIGFAVLHWHLAKWGYTINDGKWLNPLLGSMGFREISRAEFRDALTHATTLPGRSGRWQTETDMKTVSEWQAIKPAGKDRPQMAATTVDA